MTDSKTKAIAGRLLYDEVLAALEGVAAADGVETPDDALLNMSFAVNRIATASRKYAAATGAPGIAPWKVGEES